jgi:hypothetical protein
MMTRLACAVLVLVAACHRADDDAAKPQPPAAPAPAPADAAPLDAAPPDAMLPAAADVQRLGALGPATGALKDIPDPHALDTGLGTIGSSTIGHGGDIGYGAPGRLRSPTTQQPRVTLGAITVQGGLAKEIIRRYLRRQMNHFQYCYEKALMTNPSLSGVVQMKLVIAPSGAVEQAQAGGVGDEVSGCVTQAVRSIQFPKPDGGGVAIVATSLTCKGPNE